MKALSGFAKFCKGIADQLRAVYNPDLIPVMSGEVIVAWVDAKTGQTPWFS